MNSPSHSALRLVMLLFALLLGFQCLWLLLAASFRSGVHELPANAAAAAVARNWRANATRAAMIGAIRGDLWAEAAFTYADLMWSNVKGRDSLMPDLTLARSTLDHTLADAPHQSGAWLLLAGLASRYSLPDIDTQEVLKMSYYTGSREQDLMPLRLQIAAHSEEFSDIELREFISRDIRALLARQQSSAIASAHSVASPAGKRFIERIVGEIDPSVAKFLQGEVQRQ